MGWRIAVIIFLNILFFMNLHDVSHAKKKRFQNGRVSFSVRCNDLMLGYRIQSVFVLPGETVTVSVIDANWKKDFRFTTNAGTLQQKSSREWKWTIPEESGLYQAEIAPVTKGESVQLNVFVLIPFDQLKDGYLNGYRIGTYPNGKNNGAANYDPPKGFIEVYEADLDMNLTPHFTIRQFMSRQNGTFPKYIVVDEKLLIKLETLLDRVNLRGFKCKTIIISSGYRTPYYNKKIGNTAYSSHLWGRAADILIDANNDGLMDDLNRDGEHTIKDTEVLREIVRSVELEIRHFDKVGGIGLYRDTDNHGPFLHMDVRGEEAQWRQ